MSFFVICGNIIHGAKLEGYIIETNRITLKPYTNEDKEAMIELLTNDYIKKTFMIPDFNSRDEVIKLFEKLKEFSYSKEHYERGIYLGEHLIGFVNDVEIANGVMEVGYVIHPDYNNKGYATAALKIAIKELFYEGYQEIIAGAFEENIASFRVMEKCGMTKTDRVEDIEYRRKTYHCRYYSIKNN